MCVSKVYIFFPLRSLFKIREHGIQAREVSKIYHKRPICDVHGQSFESVRLIDCYAVLAYGFIGSILILIGERAQGLLKKQMGTPCNKSLVEYE